MCVIKKVKKLKQLRSWKLSEFHTAGLTAQ